MTVPKDLYNRKCSIEATAQQTEIPEYEIDALARCLLPKIQAYYASAEGQVVFEEWKRRRERRE